jgi:hypothetical protein
MREDQFTKLFKYMTNRFDKLEAKIDSKADETKVDKILGLLDAMAVQQEIDQHERLAMSNQLDRHEKWHHKAAKKLNLNLGY